MKLYTLAGGSFYVVLVFILHCLVSSGHRCLARVFARSEVHAAGPSAERGKEGGKIGRVALKPFATLRPRRAGSVLSVHETG